MERSRDVLVLGGLGVLAMGVAVAASVYGGTRPERSFDEPLGDLVDPTAAAADDDAPPEPAPPPRNPDEPPDRPILCKTPPLEIPRSPACDAGEPYPACRWKVPEETENRYLLWRNTVDEHRWGRPGLVSLVLASAAEYGRRWPGELVTIGDLDAPGPRHQTHDRGVDVDLYLPHAMIARNEGGRRYPDNYEGRPAAEVRGMRARVLDLARVLATCSDGQVRIYYNDREIIDTFREWFDGEGLRSDVGAPMQAHNRLHRFHFHLTVSEDLPPLP